MLLYKEIMPPAFLSKQATDYLGVDGLEAIYHETNTLLVSAKHLEIALTYLTHTSLDENELEMAQNLNYIGLWLYTQGGLFRVIPYVERTLEIYQTQLGTDHPYTATCLNNLAMLLEAQGKLFAARACLKQALPILRKHVPHHQNTVIVQNNLARLEQLLPKPFPSLLSPQ